MGGADRDGRRWAKARKDAPGPGASCARRVAVGMAAGIRIGPSGSDPARCVECGRWGRDERGPPAKGLPTAGNAARASALGGSLFFAVGWVVVRYVLVMLLGRALRRTFALLDASSRVVWIA